MNTIADLGHPLILQTAKSLAFKQVGLGFCAPQDREDLAQDLLLYLCRHFSRYTGAQPLVTWACRRLHGRINAINRRLFGIPSPSAQRRARPERETAQSVQREPAQEPAPGPAANSCMGQQTQSQEEICSTLPKEVQTQTVMTLPNASPRPEAEPSFLETPPAPATPSNVRRPNPQPKNPQSQTTDPPSDTEQGAEVRSWWQRLRLFGASLVSRWKRPPKNRAEPCEPSSARLPIDGPTTPVP